MLELVFPAHRRPLALVEKARSWLEMWNLEGKVALDDGDMESIMYEDFGYVGCFCLDFSYSFKLLHRKISYE